MKVIIQIRIEGAGSRPFTVPIHTIDRPCDRVQDVGLALGDAKSMQLIGGGLSDIHNGHPEKGAQG